MMNDTNDGNDDDEILFRIEALRSQEDTISPCYNYLQHIDSTNKHAVDEKCRTAMVLWCQQTQRTLKLSRETVWIAISYLDRYLSSGRGKSHQAIMNKAKFQLVAITALYIAIKLYEDVELNVTTLVRLCKGYYTTTDILSMEEDVLFALDFRVTTASPTEFVRHFIKLLPPELITESLLNECEKMIEHTSQDVYFTFCKPSVVGASCLSSILTGNEMLSPLQRQTFYFHLANITDLIEVMLAQNRLLTGHTKPVSVSKLTQFAIKVVDDDHCVNETVVVNGSPKGVAKLA